MVGTLRFAHTDADSPLLRRNIPQPRECAATSSTLYFRCTRLSDGSCLVDAHARPPFGRGPDRPRRKAAAAVRADIVQLVVRRSPRRTCIHRSRSARPSRSAAGPCRNIRSSAGVAAPWSSRTIDSEADHRKSSRETRMTNFPRFGPCSVGLRQRQLRTLLQPVQHDRRAHMRHALVRHQHVVDDVGEVS